MLLVLVLVIALLPQPVFSSSPEDELKQIQEKMAEQRERLKEALKRESSILGELEEVSMQLSKTETELGRFRRTLRRTESEIRTVTAEIEKTRKDIESQKAWLRRKLRTMHRYGYSGDLVLQIMAAEDVSQMMRIWRYLEHVARYENTLLSSYRDNLRSLDERQRRLETLRAELKKNEERVRSKELALAEKRNSRKMILTTVRDEKALRKKMLAELQEASKRLQEIIRESAKKDDYAGLGFTQLKGRLLWPADGRVALPYGSQKDPEFDTPIFRNGIHIQTGGGSDARSVHAGKVIFAEWFRGFGQLVIVNHGSGYHTLYGNLSEIFSRVGDIIKENQVIGKVGTSSMLNAPGLYFEIRYKGKPLDPMQWLRRKR